MFTVSFVTLLLLPSLIGVLSPTQQSKLAPIRSKAPQPPLRNEAIRRRF